MTEEQKKDIISAYNAAVNDMAYHESRMDEHPESDSKHSFALGTQNGIDFTLSLLGYTLIVDDADFAIDIIEEEEND